MKSFLPIAIGALSLAACSSEQTPENAANDVDTAMPAPETAPAEMDQAAGHSPQQFVDAVAASDMFEIEAAKLAQKSGKSQATKDFAAMMIKDHTASTSKLKAAAQKAQPPVTPPTALPSDLQAKLDALKSAGTNFDAIYAQQQVEAHDKALELLKSYSTSGSDAGLKAFATEIATVVEAHAKHARDLPGK